jgi:hypothetical protein
MAKRKRTKGQTTIYKTYNVNKQEMKEVDTVSDFLVVKKKSFLRANDHSRSHESAETK